MKWDNTYKIIQCMNGIPEVLDIPQSLLKCDLLNPSMKLIIIFVDIRNGTISVYMWIF